MHDWNLESLIINWQESSLLIILINNESMPYNIFATGIKSIFIPKWNSWGESISINTFDMIDDGQYKIVEIEMQSGDIIKVISDNVTMPML